VAGVAVPNISQAAGVGEHASAVSRLCTSFGGAYRRIPSFRRLAAVDTGAYPDERQQRRCKLGMTPRVRLEEADTAA
jgi:hypothetical protein